MQLKKEYQMMPLFNSSMDSVIHINAKQHRKKVYKRYSFFLQSVINGKQMHEIKTNNPMIPWAIICCMYWLCALYLLCLEAK